MKHYATVTRRDGKTVSLADDVCMEITVYSKNKVIARLSVNDGKVYDRDGIEIR